MKTLKQSLQGYFAAPARQDPQRQARREAKRLAALQDIEIEPCRPGMNVWPPKPKGRLQNQIDPYEGDHYAADWAQALERVQAYAALCPEPGIDPGCVASTCGQGRGQRLRRLRRR